MNNQQQQQQQFQHQNMQQSGSGLTRYRSAPSSYFASYLNEGTSGGLFGTEDLEQLFNPTPRATSPDTFSRFGSGSDTFQHENQRLSNTTTTTTTAQIQTQSHSQLPPRNDKPPLQPHKQKLHRQQSNDYSMMYQNISSVSASVVDNSYGKHMSSIPMKMESGGGNSGLIRHSSSPAGLFASIDIEKELGALRNFGASNITNTSRFNNQNDFSSGMMMPPISEIGSKENTSDHAGNEGDFMPGNFPVNSWDDSEILSDNFLAGIDDTDNKVPFPNDQSNEGGGKPPRTMLSHHLSLPKSSAELSAMEKLLQDSVPCKIRAKRGCATHPRSIAERVRRTKISERMRKLQELVPNMEKQTNTSDMLDLAVDFIKDLQRQVKTLSDTSAKCSCTAREKL